MTESEIDELRKELQFWYDRAKKIIADPGEDRPEFHYAYQVGVSELSAYLLEWLDRHHVKPESMDDMIADMLVVASRKTTPQKPAKPANRSAEK